MDYFTIANRVCRRGATRRARANRAPPLSTVSPPCPRIARLATEFGSLWERSDRAQPHPSCRDKCNFYFRLRTRSSRLVLSTLFSGGVHALFKCRSSNISPRSCPTTVTCAPQFYIIRGISFVCRMSIQNLNTFGEWRDTLSQPPSQSPPPQPLVPRPSLPAALSSSPSPSPLPVHVVSRERER